MQDISRLLTGDKIWINGRLATMDPTQKQPYGMLENYCIVSRGDKIVALCLQDSLPQLQKYQVIDLQGRLVTPGLIDCHTHLVFGGDRANEWEQRLNGVSYTEIAERGGGINATVKATREADFSELYQQSVPRLRSLLSEGVTTLEIKSGYGLNLATEQKILEVIAALADDFNLDISATLLAAHAVPPEFAGDSQAYLTEVCRVILPSLWQQRLFEAVDIFCENIAFSLSQAKQLFTLAKTLHIPIKGHMEQLSNLGGTQLVAELDGWSVDHIEYLDESGVIALSKSRTVATLLPCAFYFLKEQQLPPIELLRQYRVPMAVSTDFNPGTSPFASLRLAMNQACTQFGLTPEESLAGVTRCAAQALGRENRLGQIRAGFQANLAVWEVEKPVELFYELGRNPLYWRIFQGKIQAI